MEASMNNIIGHLIKEAKAKTTGDSKWHLQIPRADVKKHQSWDDSYMGKSFPTNMVPVASNGFGDLLVKDRKTGKLYEYHHETATKEKPFISHEK